MKKFLVVPNNIQTQTHLHSDIDFTPVTRDVTTHQKTINNRATSISIDIRFGQQRALKLLFPFFTFIIRQMCSIDLHNLFLPQKFCWIRFIHKNARQIKQLWLECVVTSLKTIYNSASQYRSCVSNHEPPQCQRQRAPPTTCRNHTEHKGSTKAINTMECAHLYLKSSLPVYNGASMFTMFNLRHPPVLWR